MAWLCRSVPRVIRQSSRGRAASFSTGFGTSLPIDDEGGGRPHRCGRPGVLNSARDNGSTDICVLSQKAIPVGIDDAQCGSRRRARARGRCGVPERIAHQHATCCAPRESKFFAKTIAGGCKTCALAMIIRGGVLHSHISDSLRRCSRWVAAPRKSSRVRARQFSWQGDGRGPTWRWSSGVRSRLSGYGAGSNAPARQRNRRGPLSAQGFYAKAR